MTNHYSTYFNITHEDLVNRGVYNAFLDKDSLLHIDPLLLKDCTIPEFKNAYEDFLQYFRGFVALTNAARSKSTKDKFFKRIVDRYTLKEISNTGLGYSTGNTRGRGISGALSIQLAESTYDIIKAGMTDPEIFCLMQLIEDNMGPDRISDMTISILHEHFLAYTQRISAELKLPIKLYRYSYDLSFKVPFYQNKPILFIPTQFLCDLPYAIDYDDIDRVCDYNNRLKQKIASIIGVCWTECLKYKKSDWKSLICNNRDCYDVAIEYFKKIKGIPYDFNEDRKGQYKDILLAELLSKVPFLCNIERSKTIEEEVYELSLAMCNQFKRLVEDLRLSELLYRKGRKPNETDWQLMLFMVADTYRNAGQFDVAISRESNPGVGELDFQITRGAKANTVVEIKRSCNKDLMHGYRTQLAAYMKAEQATSGIFMVIVEDDSIESIKAQLNEVKKDMIDKGEYIPKVIFINGKHQPSASAPSYKNPTL